MTSVVVATWESAWAIPVIPALNEQIFLFLLWQGVTSKIAGPLLQEKKTFNTKYLEMGKRVCWSHHSEMLRNRKGEGHSALLLTFLLLPKHKEEGAILRLHSLQTEVAGWAHQQISCDCSKRCLCITNTLCNRSQNKWPLHDRCIWYEPNSLNFNVLPISLTPEMASLSLVTRYHLERFPCGKMRYGDNNGGHCVPGRELREWS